MSAPTPRFFADADAILRIGTGLLDRSLPRAEWTHEAHLAACLWLVRERPEIDAETALPAIIRGYNEAVGGVNDDHQGYHETLTQLYIAGVRAHHAAHRDTDLLASVNALLASARGARDWPLAFYSRELLFSVAARRAYLAPDRAAIV